MAIFVIKIVLAFSLSLLLSLSYIFMPEVFFSFDNRLRDFMFVARGELAKSDNVTIVDIDEKSLKEYGQWPWPRDKVAQLLYNLNDTQAGIIGLDIVFSEEDRSSPHKLGVKYPRIVAELENYDETLAECFMQTPVVGGYIFMFEKNDENRFPIIPATFIQNDMNPESILQPKGALLNTNILQDSLYSSGFFNNIPDEDGITRSIPLVMKYDNTIYPSLALEMIRIYSGVNFVKIFGDEVGATHVEMGNTVIPTDKDGRFMVNYRGGRKHFNYISASDVINNNFDKTLVNGKFILVGTSALGLLDLRSSVFDKAIPGVEIHANAIDNILSGDYLHKPTEAHLYNIAIVWFLVFGLMLLFSQIRSWLMIPVALVIVYILVKVFYIALFEHMLMLNLLFPLIAYILTFVVSVGIDYVIVSRQKDEAKRMLGKKVSPLVMEYLLEHSTEALVASKEVETTILFSDIRSFTSISEKIGSPDKLVRLLNTYMTPMVDNIVEHKGTIDKFIGDAIMAYWNAPVKVENHADEALKSAIEQIEMLVDVNKSITKEYDVTIAIGIGVHTGVVTAGDMGSDGRSDYTIIGDNVNLASRLEGLTKQYDAQILITNETKEHLKDSYKIRPIDLVEVKGKNKAVEIHEVLCNNKMITDEELAEYNEATKLFRDAQVKDALKHYKNLQERNSSILYEFYIARCQDFIDNPMREFTPILKMTTK